MESPEEFFKEFGTEYDTRSRAENLGPEPPPYPEEPRASKKNSRSDDKEKKPPEPMKIIDPRTLDGEAVPERRWIVPDWLPTGYTTALYGDGGTGKTLLAQQLMTACATGTPWLGRPTLKCRVLALFCEDDEAELHRRQHAINCQNGLHFSDLGDMRWISGVGADNLLFTFSHDNVGGGTDRYDELTRAAKDFGASLVIVDTAADTFGGNENDRSQVRQYIGAGLNRLAQSLNGGEGGAVLLNAHPSRSGLSTAGDMDGGSTGWSNSVRSRWALIRPKGEDGEPGDTDERILSRRKANYASIGDEIKLRYVSGTLAPVQANGGMSTTINRAAVEATFLALLEENQAQGRHVSDSKNAANFAPKIFAKSPNRNGYAKREFEQAMEALFAAGAINVEGYGRPGDHHRHIARAAKNDGAAPDA